MSDQKKSVGMKGHLFSAGAMCGITLLLPFGSIRAADAPIRSNSANVMLEEIVVSARKIEENVLTVPLSIQAMTAEQMLVQGVQSIDDAAQFVPNVTLGSANRANNTRIIIRGIGGGFPDPILAFGSGMYLDGHYLANSVGGYMSTTDIERIELLRGPQGTLFGKNVTGGAVNIITTKPAPDFDSSVLLRLTEDGQADVRGMINIPINDKLFARLNLAREHFDGYYYNQFLKKDSGGTDSTSARLALRYLPNDQLTIDAAANINIKRDDNLGGQCIGTGEFNDALRWGNSLGANVNRAYPGADAAFKALCQQDVAAGAFVNSSEKDTFSDVDETSMQLAVAWSPESAGSWNSLNLTGKTAYRKMEYTYLADRDYMSWPIDGIGTLGPDGQNSTTYNVELLLEAEVNDKFRFTAGVNYFDETSFNGGDKCYDQFVGSGAATNPAISVECNPQEGLFFETLVNATGTGLWPLGPRVNNGGPGPFFQNVSLWSKSTGVFANATYKINDNWKLDFGGRFTSDNRRFTNIEFPATGCLYTAGATGLCSARLIMSRATVINGGYFNKAEDTFSAFTPMLSLTRNLENGLIYALYSEGFLTGGFNSELNSNLPAVKELLTYGPEKVANYELGFKGRFFDGKMEFNSDIFYMDYKDLQRRVALANPTFALGPNDPLNLVQNVASSAIYGLEVDMKAALWEGGFGSLAVGYLNNEYKEYKYRDPANPSQFIDQSNILIDDMTPDWTVNLGVDHSFKLSNGASLTPRANVYYQTGLDWAATAGNWPSDVPKSSCYQDTYAKLDARLTFQPANGDWQLAAFGNNLTDERILEFCDNQRGVWRQRLERPRYFGLEFSMHYGRR
jgi:iron complex outermembrane receptor protein